MATTIRVYLDGGSTPVATGTMSGDRSFSIPVANVPAGVHTFEVTAQEDGKAESARVIQTVTVNRSGLAASVVCSATVSGALTVTKPLAASVSASAAASLAVAGSGPALAASVTATATVTGLLVVSKPLAAAVIASATATANLTVSSGPISVSDSFDSALTNPPWVTLTTPSGTIAPGVSGGAAVTPGGYAGARRTETFSTSQWAEIEIATPPNGATTRVCVRVKPVALANTPRFEFSRGNYDDGEGGWYQGAEVLVWDGSAVNSIADLGTLADNFMRLEAYDVDSTHVHITVRSKATAGAAWTLRWQGTVAVASGDFPAGSPGFTLDGGSIKSFAGGDS